MSLCLVDITVNHGGGGMARIVQRACNVFGAGLSVDGKYGPKTKAALWDLASKNPKNITEKLCWSREDYYNRIVANNPTQKVFLKGWMNRLAALRKECGV